MKRVLIGAGVLLVLVASGLALGAEAILNTGAAKDRVVAALTRATGHGVAIGGPIGLVWGAVPELSVRNLVVLNGPGYSREALATVRLVEARVALWPLLLGRVEVASVLVDGPDVLLERDAEGVGNWEVARPRMPGPTGGAAPGEGRAATVGDVRVVNGRVAYAGAPAVEVRTLAARPGGGPLAGTLVVNGVALDVRGVVPAPGSPAPFAVEVTGGGAALAASGTAGGAMTFRLVAADLAAAGVLVGRALPRVADVVLTGEVAGGTVALMLVTGAAELPDLPGLTLVGSETRLAGLDQPVRVLARGALNGLPVAVAATVGPGLGGGKVPVEAVVTADGGTVTVAGDVDPAARTLTGTVSARVPDLRRAGALAGVALPGLHDVAVDVRVQPGGVGMALRGLRVTAAEADVAGDLAVVVSPRPAVRGSLQSQRVDMDALMAGGAAGVPPPGSGAPGSGAPGQGGVVPVERWLIPDVPLPFGALLRMDMDVQWTVAEVMARRARYRALQARVLLQDGRLRVDPATVASPGGPLTAVVEVDVRAEPPTVALVARGTGVDAGAWGAGVTGAVDVDVGLQARGITLHGLAGTVTGHVAATLTDGEVENAALLALAGPALRAAGAGFDATGRSRVACLAVRSDVVAGQATLPTLVLDASRLRLEGDGRLDLGQETMDVHLRPEVRLGPVPVKVPVHLTGPWRAPRTEVDKGVLSPGRFGISIGGGGGGPAPEVCGPALAAVRGGMGR